MTDAATDALIARLLAQQDGYDEDDWGGEEARSDDSDWGGSKRKKKGASAIWASLHS